MCDVWRIGRYGAGCVMGASANVSEVNLFLFTDVANWRGRTTCVQVCVRVAKHVLVVFVTFGLLVSVWLLSSGVFKLVLINI